VLNPFGCPHIASCCLAAVGIKVTLKGFPAGS
jgi:hypothetical protein